MSKDIVHDPQKCIGMLARMNKRTSEDREAVSNAIACINHLMNVVQRQRKHLANIEKK